MLVESTLNPVTGQIIGAAIEVHRILGPGLLKSTYLTCLQYELAARGLRFTTQRSVPVVYKGVTLDAGYPVDLIVELKCVDALLPVHRAQILTYMRLTGCDGGLLINFNVPKLAEGVRRVLNT